jgi:hypothetical protein
MSNDELCAYIRQLLNNGEKDLKLIAEEILDNCLRAGRYGGSLLLRRGACLTDTLSVTLQS